MPQPPRPCLNCSTPTTRTRCPRCQAAREKARPKDHYKGNYQARARQVRAAATHCWICQQGPIPGDPWQADHIRPGDPTSPLLPAHRSCNARRGNRPA